MGRLRIDVPIEKWQFKEILSFPKAVTLLYLYLGGSYLSSSDFTTMINTKGDGSAHHQMDLFSEWHWFSITYWRKTTKRIGDWLENFPPLPSLVSPTKSKKCSKVQKSGKGAKKLGKGEKKLGK